MDRNRAFLAGAAALALAAGGWYLTRGGETAPPAAAPAPQTKAGKDELAVDAAKARDLGITVATATAASEVPLADLPATISPPANARVAVPATLPGVVLRTFVVEGDAVSRGQPLATIASRDVLTLGADLSRAGARLGVAQASAARLSQLSREGIVAGARADEARALAAEAGADVSEKSRILRMVGGHAGSGSYTLTAPIAGRVTKADIQTGAPVDGTSAPYVIDADGRFEVVAQVPDHLVGTVRPGMAVRVGDVAGTVTAVGSAIDPATRSTTLKARIPASPQIIAGQVATVTVLGPAPAGAVSVPQAALTRLDGADVVFVATAHGFAVRKVKTGGSGPGGATVLEGLRAGEQVVITGTSALKALALAK